MWGRHPCECVPGGGCPTTVTPAAPSLIDSTLRNSSTPTQLSRKQMWLHQELKRCCRFVWQSRECIWGPGPQHSSVGCCRENRALPCLFIGWASCQCDGQAARAKTQLHSGQGKAEKGATLCLCLPLPRRAKLQTFSVIWTFLHFFFLTHRRRCQMLRNIAASLNFSISISTVQEGRAFLHVCLSFSSSPERASGPNGTFPCRWNPSH